MALTNAERQAEYRRRQQTAGENGRRKIEVYVTTRCALTLKRLARHRGMTQSAVLELLLEAADDAVTAEMTDDALNDYLDLPVVPQLGTRLEADDRHEPTRPPRMPHKPSKRFAPTLPLP